MKTVVIIGRNLHKGYLISEAIESKNDFNVEKIVAEPRLEGFNFPRSIDLVIAIVESYFEACKTLESLGNKFGTKALLIYGPLLKPSARVSLKLKYYLNAKKTGYIVHGAPTSKLIEAAQKICEV